MCLKLSDQLNVFMIGLVRFWFCLFSRVSDSSMKTLGFQKKAIADSCARCKTNGYINIMLHTENHKESKLSCITFAQNASQKYLYIYMFVLSGNI